MFYTIDRRPETVQKLGGPAIEAHSLLAAAKGRAAADTGKVAVLTKAEQIAALADGTRSRDEIRKALGMSWPSFWHHAARAKAEGMTLAFRPSRLGKAPLWQRVADALERDPTLTGQEIAEMLQANRASIPGAVRQARLNGREVYLPDVARYGAALTARLPRPVKAWLDAQIPKGSSRAEIIRAIILDAYHDDLENNQRKAKRTIVSAAR